MTYKQQDRLQGNNPDPRCHCRPTEWVTDAPFTPLVTCSLTKPELPNSTPWPLAIPVSSLTVVKPRVKLLQWLLSNLHRLPHNCHSTCTQGAECFLDRFTEIRAINK